MLSFQALASREPVPILCLKEEAEENGEVCQKGRLTFWNRLSYSLLPSQLSQYLPMTRQSGTGIVGSVSTRHEDWCPGPGITKRDVG